MLLLWRVILPRFYLITRLELIENELLRQKAAEILRQRDIFTPRCRQLLQEYEQRGGFNETQAQGVCAGKPGNVSLAPVSNGR